MFVGQLDRCPECRNNISDFETLPALTRPRFAIDAYGQAFQYEARRCLHCQTVFAPTVGQNTGVRILSDSIESTRDDNGFAHPNLHRRVMWCECGNEWFCQLHKNICVAECNGMIDEYGFCINVRNHCDCRPGIVCDCADIDLRFLRGKCMPVATIESRPGNYIFGRSDFCAHDHHCPIEEPGIDCGYCDGGLDNRRGRPTDRNRPNESYKLGIHGLNSYAQTEVHLHHEEQVHRETP